MKHRGRARTRGANSRRPGLYLHRAFEQAVEPWLDPWPLVADLVVERLKSQGFTASPEDRRAIEQAFRTNRFGGLRLTSEESRRKGITVTLTDADVEAIIGRMERGMSALPSIVRSVLDKTAPTFLSNVRRRYPSAIRADERRHRRQEASVARAWRKPLESLAILIELACRLMRTVDDYCAEHPTTEPKLLHLLARLHIRSVHVSREILTLLRCGYPDAAMARWRTLHEISTVMCFLTEHGEECAARYLDHQAVQAFVDGSRYQDATQRLGHRPLSKRHLAKLRAARDAVVARYGKSFAREYGWAAKHLADDGPTFEKIEKAVGRGHLRPYYRLASDNVHAGIMGALRKLGTVRPGKLLLEPTPVGLEEPGQNTALSLALVIAQPLRVCPALDALVIARTALSIADQAVQEFVSVCRSLKVTTDGHRRVHRSSRR